MNEVTKQVKKNLDLTINEPIKKLVYEAFKKTIILGDIPAGERVNEKEFAETVNISRTPVRYALKRLTDEHLLEYQPGIGEIVKGISVHDAREIYDIRKALDTLAIIRAMEKMTEDDFAELNALVQEGFMLNKENKINDVLQNFSDFNTFIYTKSEMRRLGSIVTGLATYLFFFRDIAIRAKERRDEALNEHASLAKYMEEKNEERVKIVLREHLDHSLDFIIKEMEHRKID